MHRPDRFAHTPQTPEHPTRFPQTSKIVALSDGWARVAAQTTLTVLNADLDAAVAQQVAAGAEIVHSGGRLRSVRARACATPMVVEYLEHRPTEDDVPEPGAALA